MPNQSHACLILLKIVFHPYFTLLIVKFLLHLYLLDNCYPDCGYVVGKNFSIADVSSKVLRLSKEYFFQCNIVFRSFKRERQVFWSGLQNVMPLHVDHFFAMTTACGGDGH